MKRFAAMLALLACAAAVTLPALAADGPVKTFSQDVARPLSRAGRRTSVGPVNLSAGNKVAPIWAFTNGDEGQRNIIDTVPGRKDYTPLWAVNMVTWKANEKTRILRSAAAVRAAQRAGDVTVKAMPIVVNCPVL